MVMMPHWPPCGTETLTHCERCGCEAAMSSDRTKASAVTAGHSKDKLTAHTHTHAHKHRKCSECRLLKTMDFKHLPFKAVLMCSLSMDI